MSDELRLFVTVVAPPAVQAAVAAAQAVLRPTTTHVRWTAPENAHVTLQFLGPTAAGHVPSLVNALALVAAGSAPHGLRTATLGVFPSPARARVIWLGLTGDVAHLAALQSAVVAATAPLGFLTEAPLFTPHLTLGRVWASATPAERAAIGRAVTSANAPSSATWAVEELVLMRSILGTRGPTYEAVGRWRLGDNADS